MATLGISSVVKTLSIGLADQGKVLAELSFAGQEAFTEDLIVYIDKLVKESKEKLTKIAVIDGPGSYSGIRGGLATAKTLSQTLDIPITTVSALEVLAYNHFGATGTIAAYFHALKDEYNFALFASRPEGMERMTEDLVLKQEGIDEQLSKVKGNLFKAGPDEHPRGGFVALIGEKRPALPLNNVLPKYSHIPNIREYKK
jgi:tRNA threonylcarbamoyladenosine biosynthesis protein TsaB